MKTLLLVRHAKSSHDHPGLSDFDRPLNERGKRDAPLMADRTAALVTGVSLLVSSPALRALTTARAFHKAWGNAATLVENNRIYEADPDTLLSIVQALDDRHDQVALFGHNPGFSQLASYLCSQQIEMVTCCVVHIALETDTWKAADPQLARLMAVDYPKRV
ncbi:MAG: histidine phosphatase family protein [Flavobacteriales bacterium]|nr:histidine phosphatase family protein [Flavobacteriales bacterium]